MRAEILVTQGVQIGDGGADPRPHFAGEIQVPRVTIVLCDKMDELTVAVVFWDWIGAAVIDNARDLAVSVLEICVPSKKCAHNIGSAEAKQCARGERTIPDPGSGVRTRTRLNGGSVTVHQYVRKLGVETLLDRLGRFG